MIETSAKGRAICALGLLLLVIGVANGREPVQDDESTTTTTVATLVEQDKAEARSVDEAEDSVAAKPGKSVGWKTSKDSYLEALRHSRTSTDPREGIVGMDGGIQRRKEYAPGPVYAPKRSESSSRIVQQHATIDRDSFSMLPSDSYTLPSRTATDFARIRNTYGPPSQTPRPTYGPAFNEYYSSGTEYAGNGYLPPPQQAYGSSLPYGHETPHATSETTHLSLFPSIDLSWPFALKLNAFTLAKILLKLVIFKMIVKFIAVICLLLFIPKLEIKKTKKVTSDEEEEDEGRGFIDVNANVWERLNRLTLVVNEAWDRYRDSNEDCSDSGCRAGQRRTTSNERIWPDYEQLFTSYILEETRSIPANT